MATQTSLDFKIVWEDFTTYKLEDGVVLKCKIPLNRLIDSGERNEKGDLKVMIEGDLVIRVDNVPQQTPSEDPTLKPEDILDEISFKPIIEHPQIYYEYENKQIVIITLQIKKVRATTKFDDGGYPIYSVDTTTRIRSIKNYEDLKDKPQ